MAIAVRMPALGQTSDQLRLVAWLKSEGDTVKEGEPLFEAESDKAVHEVEAVSDGTLLRVLAEIEQMITVGTVIAWLGQPGDRIPEVPTSDAAPRAPAEPAAGPSPAQARAAAVVTAGSVQAGARIAATPAARRIAREHGVELNTVTGTGPGGRIESRDVLVAAGGPSSAPGGAPAGAPDEPVPGHRQAIAQRLVRSAAVPHFSVSRTIDARGALARVDAVEGATLTHLLLGATAAVLARFPRVNRVWVDDPPRYRRLTQANVGLAIAAEDRLVVATISDAHTLELPELAERVREAVRQGREGRLSGSAGAPAAITLSNLGMFGVDRFEAIVDPDQTAILAVGRVVERPAVASGAVAVVPQIELTLSVDHRTVDGAEAAGFLAAVCGLLERS